MGLLLLGAGCAGPTPSPPAANQATVEALNAQVESLRIRLATLQPESPPLPLPVPRAATFLTEESEPEIIAAAPIEEIDEPIPEPTLTPAPTLTIRPTPLPTRTPRVITESDAAPCQLGQIKGNRNSRIYHVPGGGSYSQTKANVQCFDDQTEAEAAGYRRARN